MKQGWEIKKFEEIIKLTSGDYLASKDMIHGEYPVYGGNDIAGYHNKFNLSGENIIIGRVGALCGNARYFDSDIWLTDNAFKVNLINVKFHFRLLVYYLNYLNLRQYARQTAQPVISNSSLKNVEILIPPVDVQELIVGILDSTFAKIEALRANAQQNLQNTKDLFQASLKQEFTPKQGWKSKKLNELYNFIDYRGATPTKTNNGIPLITAKNVKMGYVDYSIKDYISEEEFAQRQRRGISRRNDILFTTEAPLGNVALADLDMFSAGQRIITLQQYSDVRFLVDNKFYLYCLMSPFFQGELKELATGATAQGIKASRLKEVNIPYPHIYEQQSIVKKLDALSERCRAMEENYRQTIAHCNALKQALLTKAFNGEL